MSERGVFAVDRGWFDHPRFAAEPFTEREAWAWLISEAAWRPMERRVGSTIVALDRGQLAHSLRFMAERWKWSEARVRRYLSRLKGNPPKIDAMIDARSDAGVTVITICNYSKYQKVSLPTDAPTDARSDAGATQERRKLEDIKSIEEGSSGGDARASDAKISRQAIELADQAAAIVGLPDPKAWPQGWYGAAGRIEAGLREGWTAEDVVTGARMAAASLRERGPPNSFGYVAKPIARAHAERLAPVPTQQPGTRHAEKTRGSSITAAIDEHIRRLSEPSDCEYGEGSTRLLSHG